MYFPKNFVWGFATAAAQIEGATFKDGKGWSVWDEFSRQRGRVHNGDIPDVACDHYHRFDDDFRLMRSLSLRMVATPEPATAQLLDHLGLPLPKGPRIVANVVPKIAP